MRIDAPFPMPLVASATSLVAAAASLDRLVELTAPGAPVVPVVDALRTVERSLHDALPGLRQSRTGGGLIDQVDRVRNSVGTLRESLEELVAADGMANFDAAFAADDAAWDEWFQHSAAIARDAPASD